MNSYIYTQRLSTYLDCQKGVIYKKPLRAELKDQCRTYHEQSHERALYESGENVAPVMLVIRHSRQSGVHRGGNQEKLDGRSQQPRPVGLEPSLQVELRNTRAMLLKYRQSQTSTCVAVKA